MLKVTITAGAGAVTIQDPRAATQANAEQAVMSVPGGETKSFTMQFAQLERIRPQLDAAVIGGLCSFVLANAQTGYAEQPDAPNSPSITAISDGDIAPAGQSLSVYGQYLTNYGVQAHAHILGDTTAGSVLVTFIQPGFLGNLVDVEVVDSGSGALAVTFATVAGRRILEVDLGGSTTETVAKLITKINHSSSPAYRILIATPVGVDSTPITTARTLAPMTGGAGLGLNVTLGGLACTLVAATPTLLTLATPALAPLSLSTGAALNLHINSNGKIATAGVTQSA